MLAAGNALSLNTSGTPKFAEAVAAAKSYAVTNFGVTEPEWAACTDSSQLAYAPSSTPCISFNSATKPTQVRVKTPNRTVALTFGKLLTTTNPKIGANANISIVPADTVIVASA